MNCESEEHRHDIPSGLAKNFKKPSLRLSLAEPCGHKTENPDWRHFHQEKNERQQPLIDLHDHCCNQDFHFGPGTVTGIHPRCAEYHVFSR